MFSGNLCSAFIDEIQKQDRDFSSLYLRWCRGDSYLILGINRSSDVEQVTNYRNNVALKVRAALDTARLTQVQLNSASQVSKLIDAAFNQVLNQKRIFMPVRIY